MKQIGTKIQTLRKNKSMTQSELAEVLSVSPQTVSKWENHLSVPDVSVLPIIARYFGITMDEMFNYRLDALNYKERFIRFMADNGVLQFGAFRLQSGRVSPYYINTGNYRSASQISKLGAFYAECIREHNIETNLLAGTTHREIPIMLATGMVLYERYGIDMQYSVEGSAGKPLEEHDKVTLIKDTLTSGSTLQANLQEIRERVGPCVSHVIVSVDRMEKSADSCRSARKEIERICGVKVHAIVDLDDIIRAVEQGVVGTVEYLEPMKRYRKQYGGE